MNVEVVSTKPRGALLAVNSPLPLLIAQAEFGVGLDLLAHAGQSVATVGREVLGDADLGEEVGFEIDDGKEGK